MRTKLAAILALSSAFFVSSPSFAQTATPSPTPTSSPVATLPVEPTATPEATVPADVTPSETPSGPVIESEGVADEIDKSRREPTVAVKDYAYNETRYRMLVQSDEARAEMLMEEAAELAQRKWELYKQMAAMAYTKPEEPKE